MADHVDIDLPCAQCGYNLRTLSLSGVCPECGMAIGWTLRCYEWTPLERWSLFGGILLLNTALVVIAMWCVPLWSQPVYVILDVMALRPWIWVLVLSVAAASMLAAGERRRWMKCALGLVILALAAVLAFAVMLAEYSLILVLAIALSMLAVPFAWATMGSLVKAARACGSRRLVSLCRLARIPVACLVGLDAAWRIILALDWTVGPSAYLGSHNRIWAEVISRTIAVLCWLGALALLPLGTALARTTYRFAFHAASANASHCQDASHHTERDPDGTGQ